MALGHARLTHLSGQLLGAHIAHAGLIVFWAFDSSQNTPLQKTRTDNAVLELPSSLRSVKGWRQFSFSFLIGGLGGAVFAALILDGLGRIG